MLNNVNIINKYVKNNHIHISLLLHWVFFKIVISGNYQVVMCRPHTLDF